MGAQKVFVAFLLGLIYNNNINIIIKEWLVMLITFDDVKCYVNEYLNDKDIDISVKDELLLVNNIFDILKGITYVNDDQLLVIINSLCLTMMS